VPRVKDLNAAFSFLRMAVHAYCQQLAVRGQRHGSYAGITGRANPPKLLAGGRVDDVYAAPVGNEDSLAIQRISDLDGRTAAPEAVRAQARDRPLGQRIAKGIGFLPVFFWSWFLDRLGSLRH